MVGVALTVVEDELSNPIDIGLFGPDGVVASAELIPHLIEESRACQSGLLVEKWGSI